MVSNPWLTFEDTEAMPERGRHFPQRDFRPASCERLIRNEMTSGRTNTVVWTGKRGRGRGFTKVNCTKVGMDPSLRCQAAAVTIGLCGS